MFDLVYKHKRAIQLVLLLLIVPPFAFFGIDQYFRDRASGQTIAKVGDYEITENEFQQALRDRQEMVREFAGGRVDAALLDNPEVRASVLDALIRQRLLLTHAMKSGLTVPNDQIRSYISQLPGFQENGQFSATRYQQMLKARNESPPYFESRVRQELLLQQMKTVYSDTRFASRALAERMLRITQQQREVSRALLTAERFAGSVKVEEGAAKKYYDSRQDEFRVPEQVRVEYVALTLDSLLGQIQVDPAEVKNYYETHQREYGVPEQRQASHILIAVDKSAPAEAKQKARAKAQQIYDEAKKSPAKFAELARRNSEDPGSAEKGGALGSFSRGSMVKAFDEAAFRMKLGEISPPVESEYGFHIIQVTGITPGQAKPFEQVRPEIERELKKQRAGRLFAEIAEKFNNIVFEQSDSLKPAAELLKAEPQKSAWLTRSAAEDARLNNPKFLQAVFSDDVLNNKRNSEAIETAPGTLVSARVIEHKPSTVQPFDQVKAAIEKKLVQTRANQLAAQEGRRLADELRQGKSADVSWTPAQLVSRSDPKGLPEPALRQVFKADVSKLPAYSGIEAPGGGFMLLRVSRVVQPEKIDAAQQKQLAEGLAQMIGEEEFNAYVASLKERAKVKIVAKDKLEKSQ